jgi:hypothetical protein
MAVFSHLLTDTITVQEQTGLGAGGDPTFAAQKTLKARVENSDQLVITEDGNTAQASHVICTDEAIGLGARVWVPGESTADPNKALRPIKRSSASDPSGSSTMFETVV